MKFLSIAVITLSCASAFGQVQIWRCGAEYTNNEIEAKRLNCTLIGPRKLTDKEKEKAAYDACQFDAAKFPTEYGVKNGMRLCKEKFGQ
jgi:hypothetical protein